MNWSALELSPQQVAFGRAFVAAVPGEGVSRAAAQSAAREAQLDEPSCRALYRNLTGVLWFVSDVSDASMAAAFRSVAADDMATVIRTRFEQNATLKPFVRRVMLYDVAHPMQAVARMQRTARAMYGCLPSRAVPGRFRLGVLNVAYTLIVFVWLFDRSNGNQHTHRLTLKAMQWIGLQARPSTA